MSTSQLIPTKQILNIYPVLSPLSKRYHFSQTHFIFFSIPPPPLDFFCNKKKEKHLTSLSFLSWPRQHRTTAASSSRLLLTAADAAVSPCAAASFPAPVVAHCSTAPPPFYSHAPELPLGPRRKLLSIPLPDRKKNTARIPLKLNLR
ncbi:hypothetical protein ACS0TY_018272 [Phlomoides rotata]